MSIRMWDWEEVRGVSEEIESCKEVRGVSEEARGLVKGVSEG